jgi:pSer/pThr/pTyr-binding forkhead associated (FHA) protein
LYLYLVGANNPDPVRFPGKGTIILGRKTADGPNDPALFDLNPYHGFSLGISRQHARITHDELGYMIEDLNSSNGTRLKGNVLEAGRTYPLRSGDDLRLGDLLIFVYYS